MAVEKYPKAEQSLALKHEQMAAYIPNATTDIASGA